MNKLQRDILAVRAARSFKDHLIKADPAIRCGLEMNNQDLEDAFDKWALQNSLAVRLTHREETHGRYDSIAEKEDQRTG